MIPIFLSVIVTCFNVALSEVYYITPSPNDSEPCLTLSQLAANSSVYLNSNTTLLFSGGDHFLDTEILIESVSEISMLSNFSSPLSATITCDQHFASFSYDSVTTLVIRGLTFVQCYHQAIVVETFTIENCTFLNHTGTVIELYNSVAYFTKSFFISNLGGSFQFHYVTNRLQGSYAGAVVKMLESNLTINTSAFQWNSAEIGAIVFCELHSNITIINSTFVENEATDAGGVVYSDSGCMVVVNSCIFRNNSALEKGGVFEINEGTLFIEKSNFSHNKAREGGVINVGNSDVQDFVTVSGSYFAVNTASFVGGAITAVNVTLIICGDTEFSNNSAQFGGGAVFVNLGLVTIVDSNFSNNTVSKFGGGAFLFKSKVNMSSIVLTHNTAKIGGALALQQVHGKLNNTEFYQNVAILEGGAIRGESCSITAEKVVFKENSAHSGAALFISENSSITTIDIVIEDNTASQGVVYFTECNANFTHDSNISGNIGSLILYYSHVTFRDTTNILFNGPDLLKEASLTISEGGAITAFQSAIVFEGNSRLLYNIAENGGGIRAILSKLHIYGHTFISNNTAIDSGGGIYLYQSELNCRNKNNFELRRNSAMAKGGGIHAVSSTITADYDISGYAYSNFRVYSGSRIRFVSNDAGGAGGGIYLENGAKIIVFSKSDSDRPHYTILFDGNTANYGGAVYVADNTISGTCASTSFEASSTTTECFFQTLELKTIVFTFENFIPNYINTKFINNHALSRGSDLFGGLLDRCTESPFNKRVKTSVSGFKYFTVFSNMNTSESITSDPVRVCFCHDHNELDCSYRPPPIKVRKGEAFTVPLAAVDQVGHVISATIHSYPIKFNESGIGEGQFIQSTASTNNCTDLTFSLFSPHDDEELIVFADGPCKDAPLSQRRIQIKFLPCKCPVGFQPKLQEETRCVCECDSKLDGYVMECNFTTQTIVRQGQPWISYVQTEPTNFSDYMIYPYCPLNYCKDDNDHAEFNLNTSNGVDAQCAAFRTGTLCGACQPGYSLSLGSPHCLKCPSYWPAILVIILVASFLAGIALIAALLVLNLTVAVGTLNGVIFYANIFYANIHTFCPDTQSSFATVFVSWLNLDIGIDMCLFEEMNVYWKTWIQLVFPSYVFFLVIVVIFISEQSKRFSELIGKKNPVATLATLILLSYTKLLHVIITALSMATLNYPGPNGGYERQVWLPNAAVDYFKGKHVPLFLAAIFILSVGVVYTALLFSWQWLLRFNKGKILRWTRNPKVSFFIETYNIPYTPQNRYWTGLLLFVRVILYIASAANVSGDPKINLLIIGSVISGVLLISKIVGIGNRIYKKWPIEVLEVASYMNLLLLCLATFFSLENKRVRKAVINISVSITFLLLLGILFYHIFTELMIKPWKKANDQTRPSIEQSVGDSDPSESFQMSAATSTVVDAPKKILCAEYVNSELRETLLDYSDI